MPKVWILDTETKGTGANMVPLEKVLRKPGEKAEPITVPRKPRPPEPKPPEPPEPRRFKVVDLMSREVLTEGTGARETLEVLNGIRSIVDINIYVWRPDTESWRLLTLEEQRVMWERRGSEGRRGV
jgi:hypothetical protein